MEDSLNNFITILLEHRYVSSRKMDLHLISFIKERHTAFDIDNDLKNDIRLMISRDDVRDRVYKSYIDNLNRLYYDSVATIKQVVNVYKNTFKKVIDKVPDTKELDYIRSHSVSEYISQFNSAHSGKDLNSGVINVSDYMLQIDNIFDYRDLIDMRMYSTDIGVDIDYKRLYNIEVVEDPEIVKDIDVMPDTVYYSFDGEATPSVTNIKDLTNMVYVLVSIANNRDALINRLNGIIHLLDTIDTIDYNNKDLALTKIESLLSITNDMRIDDVFIEAITYINTIRTLTDSIKECINDRS